MEMTINPRPEQFPLMREAAEKVALLSGVMPPALKIEDVEANSEQGSPQPVPPLWPF